MSLVINHCSSYGISSCRISSCKQAQKSKTHGAPIGSSFSFTFHSLSLSVSLSLLLGSLNYCIGGFHTVINYCSSYGISSCRISSCKQARKSNTYVAPIGSYFSLSFHSLSLSLSLSLCMYVCLSVSLSLLLGSLNFCIGGFHTSKKLSTCQSL